MKMPLLLPVSASLMFAAGCLPTEDAYQDKIKSDASHSSATPYFDNGNANIVPLAPNAIADHPGLNQRGHSGMHGDAYNSDTHPYAGPTGTDLSVDSADMSKLIGGQCGNTLFTADGTLISYCADFAKSAVYAMTRDATGFKKVAAEYVLPNRESSASGDIATIMNDTSGGAYFHIDNQDRMVLADADNNLQIFALQPNNVAGSLYTKRFVQIAKLDLDVGIPSVTLPDNTQQQPDITNVMPDWANDGLYWFVTREGHVGTVDASSGSVLPADVHIVQLPGEEIQNAMAMDANGVYIVSDYAMYHFERGANGEPVQAWRQTYDRGSAPKPGQINQGSGTTPTLMGEHDDLVAITDNADAASNIVVYRRQAAFENNTNAPVCTIPVFNDPQQANGDGTFKSASDNSLIGYHDSMIVENNYGYTIPTANNWTAPGIWRVDITRDANSVATGCSVVWKNNTEASQTVVPKLSLGTGLVYIYTREAITTGAPKEKTEAYYFGAVNFSDGKMAFKVLTGTGRSYNNNYSPITIAPDGTAYVGTFAGIVSVSQ
jgi:hypothetical protein